MVRNIIFILLLITLFELNQGLQQIDSIKPIIIRANIDNTIDIKMIQYVGLNERFSMKYKKDGDTDGIKLICTNHQNSQTKVITCHINVAEGKYKLIYNNDELTGKTFNSLTQKVTSSNSIKRLANTPFTITMTMKLIRHYRDFSKFRYVLSANQNSEGTSPVVCDGIGNTIACKIVESKIGEYKMKFNGIITNEIFSLEQQAIDRTVIQENMNEGFPYDFTFIMTNEITLDHVASLKYDVWPGVTITNAIDFKCKEENNSIKCKPFLVNSGAYEVIFFDNRTKILFHVAPTTVRKVVSIQTKNVRADSSINGIVHIVFRKPGHTESVYKVTCFNTIEESDKKDLALVSTSDLNNLEELYSYTVKGTENDIGKTYILQYGTAPTDQTFKFKAQEIVSIDQIIIEPGQTTTIVLTLDLIRDDTDIEKVTYSLKGKTDDADFTKLTCKNLTQKQMISCQLNGIVNEAYQLRFGKIIYATQFITVKEQALSAVQNENLDTRSGYLKLQMRCIPRDEHRDMFKYKNIKSSEDTIKAMTSCVRDNEFVSCRMVNLPSGDYEIYFNDVKTPFLFFVESFAVPEAEISNNRYLTMSLLSFLMYFFLSF